MRLDQRAGLGFGGTGLGGPSGAVPLDATPAEMRHARNLSVTRERYRQLEAQERAATNGQP